MKKERAIVLMLTSDLAFALGTLLVNLQATNPDLYDNVVVYHDNLSEDACQALLAIEPKLIFQRYTFEQWKKEHECKELNTKQLQNFVQRFSYFALSKYKVFEQLAYFRKVLFLDLDMLGQGDISALFEIEGVAWRTESEFVRKFGRKDNKPVFDGLDDVSPTHTAPNGGLFYASDSVDYQACLSEARRFLIHFLDCFGSVVDELTFSWVAHKLALPVTQLDHREYNVLPRVVQAGTKIVHFMGHQKPWCDELMQYGFSAWYDYYQQVARHTVLCSDKVTDFGPKGQLLRKYANEKQWTAFFTQTDFSVPSDLKLVFDFGKEQVRLNYREDISYEFELSRHSEDYKISLVIRNKFILSDRLLKEKLLHFVAQNEQLSLVEHPSGLFLSVKKAHISAIPTIWQYFYQHSMAILKTTI